MGIKGQWFFGVNYHHFVWNIFKRKYYVTNSFFFLKKIIKQKRTQKICHSCLQYEGVLQIILVYFEYPQIWLNILMYYHHLSNTMKLKGKKTYWLGVASSHFAKRQNGNDECFLMTSTKTRISCNFPTPFNYSHWVWNQDLFNATESQNGMGYTSESSPLGQGRHWEFPKPHHAWAPWAIERSIFCLGHRLLVTCLALLEQLQPHPPLFGTLPRIT